MTTVSVAPCEEIISKVKRQARQQVPKNQVELLENFVSIYFSNVSNEDLQSRSLETLTGIVLSHWELLKESEIMDKDERKVRIFNPTPKKNGWESTHTIIQLVVKDTPFLVDSLSIALSRLSLGIHLIIHHGKLQVFHEKGKITDVLAHHDTKNEKCFDAALVYIEIDHQSKAKDLENIANVLNGVLDDVEVAVKDWKAMELKLYMAIKEIETNPHIPLPPEEISESLTFLSWLMDHFTFLGFRTYNLISKNGKKVLQLSQGSGLGVLRADCSSRKFRTPATQAGNAFYDLPEAAQKVALGEQLLVFFQTNTKATAHRDNYSNCVSVLRFDNQGNVIGEYRFVGLYTSEAYFNSVRKIPVIREKVKYILQNSNLPERGYGFRKLLHILETLPRDDLFEGSKEELLNLAISILRMQERKEIRLFVRRDVFNRYVSCLIFIPKDNFQTELLVKMQEILANAFDATDVLLGGIFFQGPLLARIHYIIRIDPAKKIMTDYKKIEKQLAEVGHSWKDDLCKLLLQKFGEEEGNRLIEKYRYAFPASYRDSFSPEMAIHAIQHVENLSLENPLEMHFYRPKTAAAVSKKIHFKLFHVQHTIALSDAMPMLENMGLRVISEEPHELKLPGTCPVWINEFSMEYTTQAAVDIELIKPLFQDTFYHVWAKLAENDAFNQLTLSAQMSWREIVVLRTYARYLRQISFTFSQAYIEQAFNDNPKVAKLLVELFLLKFDPKKQVLAKEGSTVLIKKINKALDKVASLDEDRILRHYLALIEATVRTNYFQVTSSNLPKPYLSLKILSKKVPDLPKPAPLYDLFVYSPRFEGIHLRMSKVARGGLRWSDRFEDFRTEILGLVKAQEVKNSVIVPSGAKGGFICRRLPEGGTRDEILQEGIACYKGFISGMLDVADNIKDGKVVPPANTVIYDEQDPYLVVAADKGTAAFSDIANGISAEYDFWLGDAFASGGSQGYDHKVMGITAKGAWVSVERHFQEMSVNPYTQDFTVVGIGDMAGDVFGNGMLLSRHIKLVAAFNHMHIFIDPNPDTAASYKERKRLFKLPKSSWTDYKTELISKGGGIFERSAKSIDLTPQIKALLGVEKDRLEPSQLIKAILKSEVDLLWNGGIGTYVKSTSETNSEVGDRANDSLRINGNELKALSVGEGGNLGLTQLGRIEYELSGGRINTDFVDNCGGVNSSDHEVNIKILLNSIVKSGGMTEEERNKLLVEMTDEVSQLVLRNNYHQNRTLSISKKQALKYQTLYKNFMRHAEQLGKLDCEIEFLPDEKTLAHRKVTGTGLTRPELSTLKSYSGMLLKETILESNLIETHPFLEHCLHEEFPHPLREPFKKQISKHPLRREIIATQLVNSILADMGPIFIYQLQEEFNLPATTIIPAYVMARNIFQMDNLWTEIDALDNKINAQVQLDMAIQLIGLVRRTTRWFIWNRNEYTDIEKAIKKFRDPAVQFYELTSKFLKRRALEQFEERKHELIRANVPKKLATKFASMQFMDVVPNIIEISSSQKEDLMDVAHIFYHLSNELDFVWLKEQINSYPMDDSWMVLAKSTLRGDLDQLQRSLVCAVLNAKAKDKKDVKARIHAWFKEHRETIERWEKLLCVLEESSEQDPASLFVVLRELSSLT